MSYVRYLARGIRYLWTHAAHRDRGWVILFAVVYALLAPLLITMPSYRRQVREDT